MIRKSLTLVGVLALGLTAHAGPVSSAGTYEEAQREAAPFVRVTLDPNSARQMPSPLKVGNTESVAATAPTSAQAPVGEPAIASVEKPATVAAKPVAPKTAEAPAKTAPKSMTDEATAWLKNKWSSFTWGAPTKKVQPTAQPQVGKTITKMPASVTTAPVATTLAPTEPAVATVEEPTVKPVLTVDPPGLKRKDNGVAVYDIAVSPEIPRFDVGREEKIKASHYALESQMQKVLNDRLIHPFATPEILSHIDFLRLSKVSTGAPVDPKLIPEPLFEPKGRVSRAEFEKIVMAITPEPALQLGNYRELSKDDLHMLSGLLLFQQGDKCASAVGLFHRLSKNSNYQLEADYYLAICSRKLGLETDFFDRATKILESQDIYYSRKILKEVGYEVPYEFVDRFGAALAAIADGSGVTAKSIMDKLDAATMGNIAYLMSEYGAKTGKFKTTLEWAARVPQKHAKRLQARFMVAIAEYQTGAKERAMKTQEDIINDIGTDAQRAEFQALVALNLARMYFNENKNKKANEAFLKVYKNHPLWLTSLTELAWSQVQSGDYEGAIGNMYSIQSPFFSLVYKPESYVVRTIGYLNLCQYGDAYRTLSILEKEYRDVLAGMNRYVSGKPNYYQTVKNLFGAPKGAKEVDGLPVQVVREMARHRDFTNMQKALNRHIDEKVSYAKLEGEVDKSLNRAKWLASNASTRIEGLKKQIASIAKQPQLEQHRLQWLAQIESETENMNDSLFQVDLFTDAKATLPEYRRDVNASAEKRMANMKSKIDKTLAARIAKMKADLTRILDNNELLRYEVFAGSGENIRFQVAGGEKGNRIPASVLPKTKALQWAFDGEYWADEIGHYRSSLKNNCPESGRSQARVDVGGE